MKTYNFGEKTKVKIKGKELQVIQTAKYQKSKAKAIELINSGKYSLDESDFWILQNTYNDSMLYSGLIITHTGCLKINDALPKAQKFNPRCANEPVYSEYTGGLVANYVDDEVRVSAEVSNTNCKNGYPFAMLDKRLFDRVVLLKSKIAFDGIYSEAESDDFAQEKDDLANRQFDPVTGELLVEEKSLPINENGKKTSKVSSQQKQTTKTTTSKSLMSLEEALDHLMPSKNGDKMISLRSMLSSCKDNEGKAKLLNYLKEEVKKKTESSEACLVVYKAIMNNEIQLT